MKKLHITLVAAATLAAAIPAVAQMAKPGAPVAARVVAGDYTVDANHTQVVWTVDHFGVSPLTGAFGARGGTLSIDPAKPSAAKVSVAFDVAGLSTTVPPFTKHLLSADFFEVEKSPTATFTSTSVRTNGTSARITGRLTIKGITKPVTLDAKFFGAGTDPMTKKLNIGFSATGRISRSDFGLGYGLPLVPDQVDLRIAAAFERVS